MTQAKHLKYGSLSNSLKTLLLASFVWLLGFSGSVPDSADNTRSSLAGSRWTVTYINAQGKEQKILLILRQDGVMQNRYPDHHNWDEDKWSQKGRKVTLSFSDGYAIYKGVVKGRKMTGTATNQPGLTWAWTAEKTNRHPSEP